jgi:DNA modification methylase
MPENLNITILIGDCRELLKSLPDESVQTCITSPPYWGLRDYGHSDQIGLESNLQTYISDLLSIFQEVKRVLKKDGTLWLNLGDTYAANRPYQVKDTKQRVVNNSMPMRVPAGFKPKDLLGIPWRVAFALQADGWYFRSDIIWHKSNAMPESVKDRPTKAHEYIFLFSKSKQYYYDTKAIMEDAVKGASGSRFDTGKTAIHQQFRSSQKARKDSSKRNKRSVWVVPTCPYKGAHFATYPPRLIEPCVLAGSKPGDIILDPFAGSGTTGEVASKFGRSAILVELNPDYLPLIKKRTTNIHDTR